MRELMFLLAGALLVIWICYLVAGGTENGRDALYSASEGEKFSSMPSAGENFALAEKKRQVRLTISEARKLIDDEFQREAEREPKP